MERAAKRYTSNLLLEQVFRGGGFQPGQFHYGLSTRADVIGRNHFQSEDLADQMAMGATVDWTRYQFFTNSLVPVADDHENFRQPSKRIACGPHHIFTFEFDVPDPSFLETQCGWVRYRNSELNCPVGAIYKSLSTYADFAGISVCWSGNKSFHIHLVFEMALARQTWRLGDPGVNLRAGFIAHWHRSKNIVLEHLRPEWNGEPIHPDPQLQYPETYRRLPGGTRILKAPNNKPDWSPAFGMPLGLTVPQIVMWQKFREKAGDQSRALFFSQEPFRAEHAGRLRRKNEEASAQKLTRTSAGFSADEIEFIEDQMRVRFTSGSFPEFDSLRHDSSGWAAYFRNTSDDKTASSIMRETHASILLAGKALPPGERMRSLPHPLGVMMKLWRAQHRRHLAAARHVASDEGDRQDDDDVEYELPGRVAPGLSEIEQTFHQSVRAMADVPQATQTFFRRAIVEHPCTLIKGPEGAGKTTAITRDHDWYVGWLESQGGPSLTMYAFTDYATAEQKCEAFNASEQSRRGSEGRAAKRYKGVLIRSFSDLYSRFCRQRRLKEIDTSEAARLKQRSVWDAVARRQPLIMEDFRQEHARVWDEIGDDIPVFFTVHAVAHTWRTQSRTRRMWARYFWRNDEDFRDLEATELGLLVHDEVSSADLIDVRRAEVVEWVDGLIASDPDAWNGETSGSALPRQSESFRAWMSANGEPQACGRSVPVTFKDARALVMGGMHDWVDAPLSATGGYPEEDGQKGVYSECHRQAHRWKVRPRMWWRGHRTQKGNLKRKSPLAAHRIVILTTEELPAAVLRIADPHCWRIFSLETPHLPRDQAFIRPDRGATGHSIEGAIRKFIREHKGNSILAISNKASGIENARSPISARGSNDYIGKDIVQSLMFKSPAEHEYLLVLNGYTGRDDCVWLSHIDLFNQNCGRNLGFRRRGDVSHYVIAHPRLLAFLLDAFCYSRYDVMIQLSQKQRARIKALAPTKTGGPSEPDAMAA